MAISRLLPRSPITKSRTSQFAQEAVAIRLAARDLQTLSTWAMVENGDRIRLSAQRYLHA